MKDVQNYPNVDSVQTEPFESLVETYYQIKGYITSSNKWFWYFEKGKKQRGYQDIDLLAIDENETLIIAITVNLDDKIRYTRYGKLREDMMGKLHQYFERAETYLKNVQQYSWLVNRRTVQKVIAYAYGDKLADRVKPELAKAGIKLVSANDIVKNLKEDISDAQKKRFENK